MFGLEEWKEEKKCKERDPEVEVYTSNKSTRVRICFQVNKDFIYLFIF